MRRGWVHLSASSAPLAAESAAKFPLIPMWWRTETKVISFPLLVNKCFPQCFSTLARFVTMVTDCAEGVIGCMICHSFARQFDLFLPFPLYHCDCLSTSLDMHLCAWFVTPLPVSLWSVSPLPSTCVCVCVCVHDLTLLCLYYCDLSLHFPWHVCVRAWFVTPLPVLLWSVSPISYVLLWSVCSLTFPWHVCVCMICHSFSHTTVICL